MRSIRCRRHVTVSGTAPPVPRATPVMLICSRRSFVSTGTTTVRSPGTVSWPTRSSCWPALTRPRVWNALARCCGYGAARRHHVEAKATVLLEVLSAPGLRQPTELDNAYATLVVGQVRVIVALNAQIEQLARVV